MPVFTPPSRFVGLSLYAVLGVEASADVDAIKRGYRRAALKFHPDHNRSADANEEFSYLAHAHEILSQPASRRLYDETGEHDSSTSSSSSGASSASDDSSADYWRSVFPQVSADEIEAFREKYVGSAEELEDVKAAYQRYGGDVQSVLDSVPYAEADSVPRLCQLLNEHCRARISAAQQKKLQRKAEAWQRSEREEFEALAISGSAEEKQAAQAAGDMGQLVAMLARRKEEAQQKQEQYLKHLTDKYGGGDKRKRLTSGKAKGKGRAGQEEEKERGGEGDEMDDGPSEEEFQRIQAEIIKRREENRAKGADGKASGRKTNGSAKSPSKRRKTNK